MPSKSRFIGAARSLLQPFRQHRPTGAGNDGTSAENRFTMFHPFHPASKTALRSMCGGRMEQ